MNRIEKMIKMIILNGEYNVIRKQNFYFTGTLYDLFIYSNVINTEHGNSE